MPFDLPQRRGAPTRSCWASFSALGSAPWQPRPKPTQSSKNAINLFGDWLKHWQEMRELRDMNSGDFARIAQDLCITPAELDAVLRRGPHASEQLPRLLKSLGIDQAAVSRIHPLLHRDMVRVCAACGQKAVASTISTRVPRLNAMRSTAQCTGNRRIWVRNRDAFVSFGP